MTVALFRSPRHVESQSCSPAPPRRCPHRRFDARRAFRVATFRSLSPLCMDIESAREPLWTTEEGILAGLARTGLCQTLNEQLLALAVDHRTAEGGLLTDARRITQMSPTLHGIERSWTERNDDWKYEVR